MRELIGTVVSNKMMKSVIVQVSRLARHKKYDKVIKHRKKYPAHDELNQCTEGDVVRLSQTRPLSKTKRWNVEEIIKKARVFVPGTISEITGANTKITQIEPIKVQKTQFSTFASSGLFR
mmetsp:Transcript_21975/g.30520  ORF Transcript_21975/g.30520 Transcript_21975/m.30520 type:complete len:120 (+) Transcript_21975:122-481(+)|eukprot:CAMPEP_0196582866 /NCGR_PEP_ID=MMETSP1081-20130531/41037_1 /TAXON_ID=36882 /ORGANISM="Pyramimonas amylifera, Strain CCMP720" /LENGTH=119 /DNA_ID=CAMNT_0041903579 /DNA_START=122 /DNA_END=481 /DNA_ORIENTATION=+